MRTQTEKESQQTIQVMNEYVQYLYSHTEACGRFVCMDHEKKPLFVLHPKHVDRCTTVPYQRPEDWVKAQQKSLYVSANLRRTKNRILKEGLASYVQIVIPCKGDGEHLIELQNILISHPTIPCPSYVINNTDGTYDIVYLLKESVAALHMGVSMRACAWTIAEKIVSLEKEINACNIPTSAKFEVLEDEITTNPVLRMPGSYNNKTHRMVRAIYFKHEKGPFTYHELLDYMGYTHYKGKYQIIKMQNSIQKIRSGVNFRRFYFPCENFSEESKLDIHIHIKRMQNLERLMCEGYEGVSKEKMIYWHTWFQCRIYSYAYRNLMDVYDKITDYSKEIIHIITKGRKEECYLNGYVTKLVHNYRAEEESYRVTNDHLIAAFGLRSNGSWGDTIYFRETRKKKYLGEKIQNQMIAIARLTLYGMKNQEIMKRLHINKDRFYERKRRIRKVLGGMRAVCRLNFDFKHHPEQEWMKETCPWVSQKILAAA